MHYLDALKIAQLGTNFIISEESRIHYLDAAEVIKEVVKRGGHVTIERKYHHEDLANLVKISPKNITIKI